MYCVYRIRNNINGKTYIGQHKYTDESNPMGKYKGSGIILHKAYKKYGLDNFTTEILYQRIRDKSTVDSMEIWAISKYKPEYNISKGGTGGNLGEEWRRRISKPLSEAAKSHISEALKGKAFSEEHKRKLSESNKGKNTWTKGRRHSEETKKKISDGQKGREAWNKGKHTNIQGFKGKQHSDETKRRMSEARKAYWAKRREK